MGEIVTGKSYWSGKTFRHRLLTETNEFTYDQIQTAYAALNFHRYSASLDVRDRRQILKDWLQGDIDFGTKKSEAKALILNYLRATKEGFIKTVNGVIKKGVRRGNDVYESTMKMFGTDIKNIADDIKWVESL